MDAPDTWSPILTYFNTLIEEIRGNYSGSLKFDLRYVKVSDIAEQYYCEQQVEMKKIYGETENEQTRYGSEAHEQLLEDSVKIKHEEAFRKIFSAKAAALREMRLVGKHNGINILGVADYVHFKEGKPSLVLDYKFKHKVRVYDNELLQAGLYSYLLDKMGFDTSHLRYGIVAAESSLKGNPKLMLLPRFIHSKYPEQNNISLSIDNKQVSIVTTKFDTQKIIKDLEWALPFWMKQREPKPTQVKAKCMVCSFKDSCQFSLVRAKV